MSVLKFANPDAKKTNTLKAHASVLGCCDSKGLSIAKYIAAGLVIADGVQAVTIKVDGTNKVVAVSPAATSAKAIRQAINEVLLANGYDPYYSGDNLKNVDVLSDAAVVIGEAELVSLTNGANTRSFDKKENQTAIYVARFTFDVSTEIGDLSVSGSGGTAVGDANGYAANAAATFEQELSAALDNEGVVYTLVDISVTDGVFTVDIHSAVEAEAIVIDGIAGNGVRVYPDFV